MLTLYHSPKSRSTRVVALIAALDALDEVTIETVSVARQDGGPGGRDSKNPHPEGKVPFLVHDGVAVWESSAIMLYLADLFPGAGLSIPPGRAQRGAYLSWFAWYSGVVEPVLTFEAMGVSHPALAATFRSGAEVKRRLAAALADRPFLCGATITAADMLLHTPYTRFGKPGDAVLDAWVDRCAAHPGFAFAATYDGRPMAA